MPCITKAERVTCNLENCTRTQEHYCSTIGMHCSKHCKCPCEDCVRSRTEQVGKRVVVTVRASDN